MESSADAYLAMQATLLPDSDRSTVTETWEIYALLDPRTGATRYVGKGRSAQGRLRDHINETRRGIDTWKCVWIRSLLKLGLEPLVEVIEYVDRSKASEAERNWIAAHRFLGSDLTNGTDGGEGFSGSHSAETRQKMRDAKLGVKKTAEHAAAISAGRLALRDKNGFVNSEATRRKMAASHASKLGVDDVKEIRRLAAQGTKQVVIAAQFDISQSMVSKILNGRARRDVE